jgi:hypothetical protein
VTLVLFLTITHFTFGTKKKFLCFKFFKGKI